ncbi:MAG: hypothetical protein IJ419_09970 [Agathobacter sp.]|nr:hypothetical protein [Agathobacter sp.]
MNRFIYRIIFSAHQCRTCCIYDCINLPSLL